VHVYAAAAAAVNDVSKDFRGQGEDRFSHSRKVLYFNSLLDKNAMREISHDFRCVGESQIHALNNF